MENTDNLSRQADEIEALTAIYGDEWCVVDEGSRIYCIRISDNTEQPKWTLSLQVCLPSSYPRDSPPEYRINAGWLRGQERIDLENKLSQTYCDNIGEDLIFLWVEAVREFLQTMADRDESASPTAQGRVVVQTLESEEGETGDDGFDPQVLSQHLLDYSLLQSDTSHEKVICPDIVHGETMTDRKSTFQAHLARVSTANQVKAVMQNLLENKKIANATHNMLAYRIRPDDSLITQACDDDGETHAGSRMLHLMQIMDVENVMVVVSRWYGGIQLGPDRFKHINNCTRQILEANGFTRDKDSKKGPRSGKKSR